MREKRDFAKRSGAVESREVRKKYFLVYEGKNTEDIYFDGISEHRGEIGINPLIELVPIMRSYSEEGWSNPKKIVDRMRDNLQEAETGEISYQSLLDWIMEYLSEEDVIYKNRTAAAYVWSILQDICRDKLHVEVSNQVDDLSSVCSQIIDYLKEETKWNNIIKDVPLVIENRAITYDKSLDKICFVIDRDRESFVSKDGNDQYSYVLQACKENNYGFYLSNPCFEFWLLMHFDEVANLDAVKILENPKVSARHRYTEHELRRLLPGYSKSKYQVDKLIGSIGKAIQNEKLFCEDEEQLENTIGSRVGLLMEELIQ
ncbi:MAG: RloB family protein [Lachnospiraceae bacterium]|nr:RloB family protein [Lachnospiraceae bacterium]